MKELLLAVALAHGADTATSLYSFHHGGVEANPLILSTRPVPFTLQMAGGAALEIAALRKLSRSKPKLAMALAMTSIALRGTVAAHNIHVGRREARR